MTRCPEDGRLVRPRIKDLQALLEKHRQRPQDAWGLLFDVLWPPLHGYLRRCHADADTASDIIVEACAQFSKQYPALLERFGPEADILGWLFHRCLYLLQDHWKKRHEVLLGDIEDPRGSEELNIDLLLFRLDKEECLNALPAEQYEVVTMHLDGHSVDDIVPKVDRSRSAVGRLLHSGLTGLRHCLRRRQWTPESMRRLSQ